MVGLIANPLGRFGEEPCHVGSCVVFQMHSADAPDVKDKKIKLLMTCFAEIPLPEWPSLPHPRWVISRCVGAGLNLGDPVCGSQVSLPRCLHTPLYYHERKS